MIKKQITNFILVGGINTIFYYTLYSFLIFINFNYIIAVLLATIIGVFFNFKTFSKFVFYNNDNSLLYRFIITYIVLFFLNILFIKIFSLFGLNYYYAGFFAIIPYSIISFLLNKFYVFKNSNKDRV